MASPPLSVRLPITPSTPASGALRTPLSDDAIWKRLRDAGFDEDSIKRRDKAALIAYIAKLESEIYNHQHHMGLLILEKKQLVSKYEGIKASAESTELMYKREQAARASALAEARKREENLRKTLGIEKECIANIEKALHEMRAECAEAKVAADSKLSEAQNMVEDAQKKFANAEEKLRAAESLEVEANRYHRAAERKLHEVEAREDDLRRRMISFKADCDAKEKDILLERQSLLERKKTLQQSQDGLFEGQSLLNQREQYILNRSQELDQLEKSIESSKASIEKEVQTLNEERTNLEQNIASLSAREEAVIKRECELRKREEELLVLQEKITSEESDGIKQVMVNHEASLRSRKSEFEAELEMKQKLVEEEIETKRRAWELKEIDLRQREDLILEKEHDLEVQSRLLANKENDLTERTNLLDEKEKNMLAAEREIEVTKELLQKEKEVVNSLKIDLQKSLGLLEDRKKQVDHAEEKVEAMKSETNDLLVLEMRLKEEIYAIRAQKLELEVQADELKTQKARFETEWELIDEKREELRKEAEHVAEERLAITKFLKDERDCLKSGTAQDGGVNFAIYSSSAVSATLCLMRLSDLQEKRVTEQISLDPVSNKTGDVWHAFLKGDFEEMLYCYKFDGKFSPEEGHYYDFSQMLLDPYAKAVISREEFGVLGPDGECWPQMAGMVPSANDKFDWEGDLPLKFPQRDLVIYEMHVRGFTRHDSSKTKFPGTFLGVVEKLDHLKELGVNCIELMPCHEFNELEYYSYNTILGDYRMNFWGYSTVNYFSPMIRYSSAGNLGCGQGAVNEFKLLVKEAHKRGFEVIMDVVLNHTAEGNEKGPMLSFRGVDNSVFYMLAPKGEYYNYSGCGNTFNCNHPVVRKFIVDCLRYWVTEMHVDGFRFDLASILTRGSSLWDATNVYGNPIDGDMLTTGTPLSSPPVIDMISNDPLLRGVKLIAEAWDCGGLYQVGMFPHWGIWSEWNGKYRDIVRQFIKGTDGFAGAFAECLCGSPNSYQEGGRKPWNSINFICAHDGFTLADLVMYNNKHNLANGEDNNDGENHNNSWNCGQEGEFVSISVEKLRKRQMRNFFLCLMVSQGVPMIYMGDEYGHTKGGNNNTYCHDNYINYFQWDKKEEASSDFFRFCCLITKFRHECESLGLNDFPTAERLQWHGHSPGMPDWSETSKFVAFTLIDSVKGELYIAFNTSHLPVIVTLPERPGYTWEPLVDTGKPAPFDFLSKDLPERDTAIKQYAHFLDNNMYPMLSYSSIILLLSKL